MAKISLTVPEWLVDLGAWITTAPLGQQNQYCAEWDAIVARAIRDSSFGEQGCHTVSLGSGEVWIANFPYAYGNPHSPLQSKVRPSRKNIRALRRHLSSRVDYTHFQPST